MASLTSLGHPAAIVACVVAILSIPGDAVAGSNDKKETEFGLGVSARQLRLTRGLAELFTESAPPGTRTEGYSIDFARRGKDLEFVFGFGYDRLEATNGYYLQTAGDPLVAGQVDYITFDNFEVYTIDAALFSYLELHKVLALRYGAGLGVGVVRGEIQRTDQICTSENLERDCAADPDGAQQREAMDIPPAIPIFLVQVGIQFRPTKAIAINIEAGIRNVPYIGASAMLYLW
tara:strand:+ start:43605 stop:44303 length:699 start_codon:yes stop_codon:yes gene_type:complete